MIQSFWGQCFREVLFTDTVETVPGEFLAPLIDKDTIFIEAFWVITVSVDIELKELNGLVLKFYESETISLASGRNSRFPDSAVFNNSSKASRSLSN